MLVSETNVSQKLDDSYPKNSIDSDALSFLLRRKSISDFAIVKVVLVGILNLSLINSILFLI